MKEFKGTKEVYPIDYAGIINMNDEPYYEGNDVLDAGTVGEETAKANGKLFQHAYGLLKSLHQLIHLHHCEMEGISSGIPTAKEWQKALREGERAIEKALG